MKRNRIKTISVLIGLLAAFLHTATLYGQDVTLSPAFPPAVPQTPEVTRLIGMLKYPVSYNTGLVKTEIPIYEIKLASGYTLPIKLVYQSSGFKPGERSFVGAGWSLVAEPQIAHAVNGLPDEMPVYGLYMNRGTNISARDTLLNIAYGYYDAEPDQYFYLLPNKGGSFFLNRPANDNAMKEFVTVPYDPIRIDNSSDLKSFDITDTDGVKYHFIPTEESTTVTETRAISNIAVYKANSIVTPQQETITFSYEGLTDNTPYKYTLHNYEQSATLDIMCWDGNIGPDYCLEDDPPLDDSAVKGVTLVQHDVMGLASGGTDMRITVNDVLPGNGHTSNGLVERCNNRSTNYWEQRITSRYPSRITFPGGSIEFTYIRATLYLTAQKILNNIVIKDSNDNVIRRFQLLSEPIGERPCLNAILQWEKDGKSYRKYGFTYWDRTGMAYDSPQVNPWGYSTYYTSGNTQTDIPRLSFKFSLYSPDGIPNDSLFFCYGSKDYYNDGDDSPNLQFMLKKVTYPTGAYTEFYYEPNKFDDIHRKKSVSNGSLRIREIRNCQENGTAVSRRRFKYGRNECGIGLSVRTLEDTDFMTSAIHTTYFKMPGYIHWREAYHMYKVQLHAHPVVNDFLESSASIVYDVVTEYRDEEGKCGKNVYEYDYSKLSSIRTTRTGGSFDPLAPLLYRQSHRKFRDWSVGQLIRKRDYDSTGKLLREERHNYREREGKQVTYMICNPVQVHEFSGPRLTSWEKIRILKLGGVPNSDESEIYESGFPEDYLYDGRTSFRSGHMELTSTTTREFDGEKFFETHKEYAYNDQLLLTQIRTRRDMNQERVEMLSYPGDFTDAASRFMVEHNWISPVVRRVITEGDARYDVYNPYRLSSDIPVIDRIETGKGNNPREVRIRFTRYDSGGNLIEAVKDNSTYLAYIRAYAQHYPVAEIRGENADAINNVGKYVTISDSTSLVTMCSALREQLRGKAQVTSYTYRPFEGISSITSPSGNLKSFIYNGFGELAAELDYNGHLERSHSYYYKMSSGKVPSDTYHISATITPQQSRYYLGTHTFTVTVSGGSPDYTYQWFLSEKENPQYQTQVSTSSTFSYKFTQVGSYQLVCRVSDSNHNSCEAVVSFDVVMDMSVAFDYINHFEEGNERFMEAEFNCPVETDMTFSLEYDTDTYKGITYYITGADGKSHKFVRKGKGAELVTVHLPQGRARVYIVCNKSDRTCALGMISATEGITFKYPYHINLDMF